MIQDKIFFDEKDPTGLSYNTPFTYYGSYQGRLWSKATGGEIKYYTQNSDLSVYATTGSNQFSGSQTITGSLTVTGTITGTVAGTTATASYVEYTNVVNKPALISGSAQIASFGIFATTGSNGFNGSQSITGSLTVTGQVVAQTLNVQQVTSSVVFSSGSNIFGNSLANTQQFTGSLQVSGSSHNILGNVGIGPTGTPVAELQIGKSSDVTIAMSNSSSVTSGYRGSLAWYNSSNSTVANIRAGAVTDNVGTQLEFYTRPAAGSLTQRLTLDSAGNLGLGVTPSAWENSTAFQVGNNYAFTKYGITRNTVYNTSYTYISNGFANSLEMNGGGYQFYIAPSGTAGNAISFTQAMTLDASGRLGIVTTSPSSFNAAANQLVVGTTSGNNGITIVGGTTNYSCLFFADGTTGNQQFRGYVQYNHTDDALEIGTTGTERMRITSGGEVNIGGFGTIFPVLTVKGIASSPHIGSTWSVSANQDGTGRTIIGTAGQGRSMYFENNGDIVIPNNTLEVGGQLKTSSGQTGGYVRRDSGFVNETATITENRTAYFLYKYTANSNGSSSTTFNITGLSTTNGTWADINLTVRKDATANAINTAAIIQINGQDMIGTVFASGTAAVQTIRTFRVTRIADSWTIIGAVGSY